MTSATSDTERTLDPFHFFHRRLKREKSPFLVRARSACYMFFRFLFLCRVAGSKDTGHLLINHLEAHHPVIDDLPCPGSSGVEQWTENPRVGGSIPPPGTTSTSAYRQLNAIEPRITGLSCFRLSDGILTSSQMSRFGGTIGGMVRLVDGRMPPTLLNDAKPKAKSSSVFSQMETRFLWSSCRRAPSGSCISRCVFPDIEALRVSHGHCRWSWMTSWRLLTMLGHERLCNSAPRLARMGNQFSSRITRIWSGWRETALTEWQS